MGRQQQHNNSQQRRQQQQQAIRLYRAANSSSAVRNNNDIEQQQHGVSVAGRHHQHHLDHHRSVTSISDVDIDPTIIVFRNSTRNGIIVSSSDDDIDREEMERSGVRANLEGHVTRLGFGIPREAIFEGRPQAAAGRERMMTLPL